jgi:hypothetical protein
MSAAATTNHKSTQPSSSTSTALQFDQSVTAGNLIVACIGSYKSGGYVTYTAKEGASNTMTLAGQALTAGNPNSALQFYLKPATGGTTTITVTPSASAYNSLAILECSGIDASALDSHNELSDFNVNTAGGGTPSTTLVTVADNCLMVAIITHDGSAVTTTAANGWSIIEINDAATNQPYSVAWKLAGTAGTQTVAPFTLTATDSRHVWISVAAYKPAAGGGVPIVVLVWNLIKQGA